MVVPGSGLTRGVTDQRVLVMIRRLVLGTIGPGSFDRTK